MLALEEKSEINLQMARKHYQRLKSLPTKTPPSNFRISIAINKRATGRSY